MTCIVLNCTSSRNNKNLKFHHIPSDPERIYKIKIIDERQSYNLSKQWITACNRTDLINESPKFLKNKFVCSLHFDKSMYRNANLKKSAKPSLSLTGCFRDSFTQTWDSVKFIEPGEPTSVKMELPDLTKTEDTASYTQTEEFIFNANYNQEVKQGNDNTELEIKSEDETELSDEEKDEMEQTSTDSEQQSEDETSEMSIDEFLKLNEELEDHLRKELQKKHIIPTPIQNETNSRATHKEVQTDYVTVYDIPKNNKCFQQCLRCGKNANRLKPILKPDHRITLEEFEAACERFLSPKFCATVKTQIKLEKLLNQTTANSKMKQNIMPSFGATK